MPRSYYLARMFDAGETRCSSAAVWCAWRLKILALPIRRHCNSRSAAKDAYRLFGFPRRRVGAGEACVYLATSAQIQRRQTAFKAAMSSAKENGSLRPPNTILNAPHQADERRRLRRRLHLRPRHAQCPFPARITSRKNGRQTFYDPPDRGFEREISKRLDYWAKLRAGR